MRLLLQFHPEMSGGGVVGIPSHFAVDHLNLPILVLRCSVPTNRHCLNLKQPTECDDSARPVFPPKGLDDSESDSKTTVYENSVNKPSGGSLKTRGSAIIAVLLVTTLLLRWRRGPAGPPHRYRNKGHQQIHVSGERFAETNWELAVCFFGSMPGWLPWRLECYNRLDDCLARQLDIREI